MERHESHLFVPHKALGEICSNIAPVFRFLPTKRRFTSILCAIDNIVVQYSAEKLRQVEKWIEVGEKINFMIPFGEVLVAIDEKNSIHVMSLEDGAEIVKVDSPENFVISAAVHPSTYLNKILLGSKNGRMRLINIKVGKLIHEFSSETDIEITVLEVTPVIDIIAIGFRNGLIKLVNIKFDETLFTFKHDCAVTSITFRTDGEETMTSATEAGSMAVWDLNSQKLIGQVPQAHSDSITKLYFLCNEPIMVSAGCDNTLKTWIYDMGDKMPRQLILLEGHSKPVSALKFIEGTSVLSSSYDGTVRFFNIIRDTHRQKLGNAGVMSRAKAKKLRRDVESIKLNAVVEMDFGVAREAAWDNVLCRHDQLPVVTTWSTRKQKLGSHRLLHKRFVRKGLFFDAYATAIKISACGNFAIIGYSTGHIDCFNIQSGLYRKSFRLSKGFGRAHRSAVNGLALDFLNKQMVSGEKDGIVRFWDFQSTDLMCEFRVPSPIVHFRMNECNSLLAVAVGVGAIGIIDVLCKRVVRIINNAHKGNITAIEFSFDGRWLLSASDDCLLKVWDLASNSLIDVMKFMKHCTGISFSPSGEYLATSHDGQRAVFIWVNKILFLHNAIFKVLPSDYEPEESSSLPLCRNYENNEIEVENEDQPMEVDDSFHEPITQIDDLITLSGFAPSRWANLWNIRLIKERNKPIEPPKKPKAVPFFLPSVSTLKGFEFEDSSPASEQNVRQKIIMAKRSTLEIESSFARGLLRSTTNDDLLQAFNSLKSMNISSIDFQIRALPIRAHIPFLQMLLSVLKSHQDFELVQSFLASYLTIHYETLWNSSELSGDDDDKITEILIELCDEEKNASYLDELVLENIAVIQYIKSALL
ncbi:unnamed protein product [Dracunculus medinensis]|uniref:WD_REPEATS_REGION domain-containing protein n=1 Tax=Dracunculus medinensis TaxID=318479 RepID=A0A158Q3U1_DRAME|nr:unnamed protein product [Dracunculus medinensis]